MYIYRSGIAAPLFTLTNITDTAINSSLKAKKEHIKILFFAYFYIKMYDMHFSAITLMELLVQFTVLHLVILDIARKNKRIVQKIVIAVVL